MKTVIFKSIPFDKELVTLALESGVDAILVDRNHADEVQALSKVATLTPEDITEVTLAGKKNEAEAVKAAKSGKTVILNKGWEIIPVENILAQVDGLALECESLDRAILAAGILERGCDTVVVLPEGAADLKRIVAELKLSQGTSPLQAATVTAIEPTGLGHRVCVDTISVLKKGQGMLIGNSSAFSFLVHAETESNPYVAARPFRINAGAVHAYAQMPGDATSYLDELGAGDDVLIVNADGNTSVATVGRVKVEVRPMLLITAETKTPDGVRTGQVFLQNAETIRLVSDKGEPVSVVALKPGDTILVKTDEAGRHFGMRIKEEIKEG